MFSAPSLYTGSCNETGSCIASKLYRISSLSTHISFAIISIVGSFPFSLIYFSLNCIALYAKSLIDLLTLILLLSLRYLLTSPYYHRNYDKCWIVRLGLYLYYLLLFLVLCILLEINHLLFLLFHKIFVLRLKPVLNFLV